MSPGGTGAGECFSERARGANRVTNTCDFDCTKRVHGRVHDMVQVAGMAGATKVAMHRCTEAVTAHVRLRACRAARDTLAQRPWAAALLRSSSLRDRGGASRVRFAAPW
jgi:hypothetical protein